MGRLPLTFRNNIIDAAMGDMGIVLKVEGGFYANPAVIYDNVFFTLKSRKLVIKTPKDLDSLYVVSSQGAVKPYHEWLKKIYDKYMAL